MLSRFILVEELGVVLEGIIDDCRMMGSSTR